MLPQMLRPSFGREHFNPTSRVLSVAQDPPLYGPIPAPHPLKWSESAQELLSAIRFHAVLDLDEHRTALHRRSLLCDGIRPVSRGREIDGFVWCDASADGCEPTEDERGRSN